MNDQERRAEKVERRDRALRAIRQADAFLLVTVFDGRYDGILCDDEQGRATLMMRRAIDCVFSWPSISDHQALELTQAIEAYAHEKAELLIAELEERRKE